MSSPSLYTKSKESINERDNIQEQIQTICDLRPPSERTRLIRRASKLPNEEVYHSLIGKLASVTDEIRAIERKIQNKNKIVRFSNLRPQYIPIIPKNSELPSMPLNRTPPPTVTSTPIPPSSLPRIHTVLIANTTNSSPIYSSPITTQNQHHSHFVPLINVERTSSILESPEGIFSTSSIPNSHRREPSHSHTTTNNNMSNDNIPNNNMPNNDTNNNMPNNNIPNSNMPNINTPNNNMPGNDTNNGNNVPNNNNSTPNYNASNMGHTGRNFNSMPNANQFTGSSSFPNHARQQQSFPASRNSAPENGTETLLELTQYLADQMRGLRQDMNNMNVRITENENTMHKFHSTLAAVNPSMDTAANFSGLRTISEPQSRNRRIQSDFESKYIWKKIERIPFFDGKNLNGLNSFISSCDSVSRTLNDFGNSEHRCAFLSEIDQKITDHAFKSSYETYDVE